MSDKEEQTNKMSPEDMAYYVREISHMGKELNMPEEMLLDLIEVVIKRFRNENGLAPSDPTPALQTLPLPYRGGTTTVGSPFIYNDDNNKITWQIDGQSNFYSTTCGTDAMTSVNNILSSNKLSSNILSPNILSSTKDEASYAVLKEDDEWTLKSELLS